MNQHICKLQPYPFEKLRDLFSDTQGNGDLSPINLSIGEPKAPTPEFIKDALKNNLDYLSNYPKTKGESVLRESIAAWLTNRFNLPEDSIDPEQHILPVNGTREALFSFAQCLIDSSQQARVISPNPFYQIYEGAALLAGAHPVFLDFSVVDGEVPGLENVDSNTWKHTQLVYICTPSNPTGDILPQKSLQKLIGLAHEYNFVIASDECYSEIYFDEQHPPAGILQACLASGDSGYSRCIAFYSLSKRSNSPGLRSGFVAGDQTLISLFFKYRTYHGCAMPISTQFASVAAWSDEQHVFNNRERYRKSFDHVIEELKSSISVTKPQAAFYLWLNTPIDDEAFAHGLYSQQNVTVLPGKYLSRSVDQYNPGSNHVRIALVAKPAECSEAASRINEFIKNLN
ncbi:MAG: succinyldiaminopimelate transaminase [Pseudomonadota bacterium]